LGDVGGGFRRPASFPLGFAAGLLLNPDMDWTTHRSRSALRPAVFIEPSIPTLTDRLPTGPLWIHEIKHDGFVSSP
jgi:hypothetical protein